MDGNPKTLDEATAGGPDEASFWHAQLREAAKVEEHWRIAAGKFVDRYRDDKREGGTKLNLFYSNIETLKPRVYSQTPAPDVRRRRIDEDPLSRATGRNVAMLLERALAHGIDAWGFDPPMRSVRDDQLIVGRGVSRETYEVEFIRRDDVQRIPAREPVTEVNIFGAIPEEIVTDPGAPEQFLLDGQPVSPEFDKETGAPYVEQKADERVVTRYVFWADYRMSPCRQWDDCWWVAYRHAMTRDQLKDEFGPAGAPVKLTLGAGLNPTGEEHSKGPKDPEHAFERAVVWEIWNKRKRERVWVAEGHRHVIRKDPDPLNLEGFFPQAAPLYAIPCTDSMVPIPEGAQYLDQLDELDELQSRIAHLTRVLKAIMFADGDSVEMLSMVSAEDGTIIPISRPGITAGDMNASLVWWRVGEIMQVIGGLSLRAEQVKMQIYEVMGLSDLSRGAQKERESATASRAKVGFGEVRMTPRSQPMAEFIRDTLRLKAEIMAEMFDPATLQRIGGMPVDPGMVEMMREERLRNVNIEVATDSTVRPDKAVEKEEAVEAITAIGTFLERALPVALAAPTMVPLLAEMLKAMARPFKWGRQFEDTLEQTADTLASMPPMPPAMPPGNGASPQPPGMMQ